MTSAARRAHSSWSLPLGTSSGFAELLGPAAALGPLPVTSAAAGVYGQKTCQVTETAHLNHRQCVHNTK